MTSENIALTSRERDSIMAALRMWQAHMRGEVTIPADRADAIVEIARNGRAGLDASLSFVEIDALCERLNRPTPPMAAHSPAPWAIRGSRSPVTVMDAKGESIAKVYLTDAETKRRDAAHMANARLIAAAPDMLAALLAIKRRFDWDADHDIADSVVDMVIAAIAAATEG